AFGHAALIPEQEPASLETIYDLASLTKPLATTTAILCLVQDRRLGLDDSLADFLPELKERAVGRVKIFHLLNHSSGLPAWRPLYQTIFAYEQTTPGFLGSQTARRMAIDCIGQEALVYPTGSQSLYSDLGFILLGMLVERISGCSLAVFCRDRVYDPLHVDSLFFLSAGAMVGAGAAMRSIDLVKVAPTEHDSWRGRLLRAEVHDENAYALGGIAGHAGLFGTASAVLMISGCWLQSYLGRNEFLPTDLVRQFTVRQATAGSSWGLGWDTPSAPSSSGTHFSPQSFGHLGFTGTSIWVDPVRELEVVLLSNRVHPTRHSKGMQQFRPLIHDVIYREVTGNCLSSPRKDSG
ncbi:MAG: serine hydrolase, partial [Nitrospiraceae bacterium]